jgi:hypothetical protein
MTDSHFGFVGADESFTPDLNGSIRVGGNTWIITISTLQPLSPYVMPA